MQKSINGLTSRTVAEENQISSAKDDSRKMHKKISNNRKEKLSAGKNS